MVKSAAGAARRSAPPVRVLSGSNSDISRDALARLSRLGDVIEGPAIIVQHGDLAGEILETADDHVAVSGIELYQSRLPSGLLGGDQG